MENCNKYQDQISAFIDGLLTEEERLELMEHMAGCPACQQYFDDQIAIHDAVISLEADAPEGFTDAVLARVRETKQDTSDKKAFAFPHWKRWIATAACCAVAALGVMSLGSRNEFGPAASQNAVSYDLARSESVSVAADTSAADDKSVTYTTQASEPASQMESAPADEFTACALEDSTEAAASAPTVETALVEAEADAESRETGPSAVLTTASPLAEQWVEEHLNQSWQSGGSYELTTEQFVRLRGLLDDAGEPYTVEVSETGGFLLLAEP